jgi:transglutaminase-like putative cysteine protease
LSSILGSPPLRSIDHRAVDWGRVRHAVYSLRQEFLYDYPGPITDLHQRLIVVPPSIHGDQHLRSYTIEVDPPEGAREETVDRFGNRVVRVHVPRVTDSVRFAISLELERSARARLARVAAEAGAAYLEPTPLTLPDGALVDAARRLRERSEAGPLHRAIAITRWLHDAMTYDPVSTTVSTTAAEAFSLRAGVCQDYAQIMIVLCRLNGIPARYVSGHLLGEGGTHAWVEVLTPSPETGAMLEAHAFDPTHGRAAGMTYLTVATGRDYRDVAPVSGTFTAPYGGSLRARKQAQITALELAMPERGGLRELGAA